MKRGLKDTTQTVRFRDSTCSNLCPDEKGTESAVRAGIHTGGTQVATYAPMKRGLKDSPVLKSMFLKVR